jgi:hypothetical protein
MAEHNKLFDVNGKEVLNWDTLILKDTDEVSSVEWLLRKLKDGSGNVVMLWNDRRLIGNANIDSINWWVRTLNDDAGDVIFKWATQISMPQLTDYADNAAAVTGGLVAGDVYHTAGTLKVVI